MQYIHILQFLQIMLNHQADDAEMTLKRKSGTADVGEMKFARINFTVTDFSRPIKKDELEEMSFIEENLWMDKGAHSILKAKPEEFKMKSLKVWTLYMTEASCWPLG